MQGVSKGDTLQVRTQARADGEGWPGKATDKIPPSLQDLGRLLSCHFSIFYRYIFYKESLLEWIQKSTCNMWLRQYILVFLLPLQRSYSEMSCSCFSLIFHRLISSNNMLLRFFSCHLISPPPFNHEIQFPK